MHPVQSVQTGVLCQANLLTAAVLVGMTTIHFNNFYYKTILMGKVRITIKISRELSRYQRDKLLGEKYRNESQGGESFNDWLRKEKRKKNKYY